MRQEWNKTDLCPRSADMDLHSDQLTRDKCLGGERGAVSVFREAVTFGLELTIREAGKAGRTAQQRRIQHKGPEADHHFPSD